MCDIAVPGDKSSAAYFIVTEAVVGYLSTSIINVETNPMRIGIIDVLKALCVS